MSFSSHTYQAVRLPFIPSWLNHTLPSYSPDSSYLHARLSVCLPFCLSTCLSICSPCLSSIYASINKHLKTKVATWRTSSNGLSDCGLVECLQTSRLFDGHRYRLILLRGRVLFGRLYPDWYSFLTSCWYKTTDFKLGFHLESGTADQQLDYLYGVFSRTCQTPHCIQAFQRSLVLVRRDISANWCYFFTEPRFQLILRI